MLRYADQNNREREEMKEKITIIDETLDFCHSRRGNNTIFLTGEQRFKYCSTCRLLQTRTAIKNQTIDTKLRRSKENDKRME